MVMGNMTVEHSQNGYVNKIIQLNAEIRQGIAAAAVKPPEPDSENFNEEVDAYTKLQGKTDEVLQKWIEVRGGGAKRRADNTIHDRSAARLLIWYLYT